MTFPRFYPILDTTFLHPHLLVPAARQILDAGARILQFRHKNSRHNDFFTSERFAEVEQIAALCRAAGAMFIVNDRADVARLLGAGVHLGQQDLTPSQARPIAGPDAVIGFSTHNETQFRAAASEPATYLAIGPVFCTNTKENPDPVVGLEELRRLRPLTNRPLVAIGGITRLNARAVLDSGADSVAVISDLYSGDLSSIAAEWVALTAS